jgi:hypothetical protein
MTKDDNRESRSNLYDEVLFGIRESKIKSKKTRLLRLYSSFILSLVILLSSVVVLFTIIENNEIPDSYFSKSIKSDIKKVVENDGDLLTIKHIYNTREIKKKKLPDFFTNKQTDYYPESTSLNEILNDLKVEYYTSDKRKDSYLNQLNEIINLHNQINPFDKLETNQKFAFENIRDKLDSNYVDIQEELNRIADEMNSKNLLVDKYLEKSNLSYWISVIALVLTIILSTIQIYQNRNQRVGNLLRNILKNQKDENSDKSEE